MSARAATAALVLGLVNVLILLVYAVGLVAYVIPVFRLMLASGGSQLSAPSRFALAVAGFGVILVPVLVLVVLWLLWRWKGEDGAVKRAALLAGTNLLLTLYVVLLGSVFVDAALRLPGHVERGHPAAGATLRVPTVTAFQHDRCRLGAA